MTAWSYSALTSYETCPRRHYETRVAKTVREAESSAILIGNAAHKVLELRVKTGCPIPATLQVTSAENVTTEQSTEGWEPLMARILQAPGEFFTERQIALNRSFQEVPWFDKDVWVRGVVDLGAINGEKAMAIDHKTGKRKPDSDQLMLFAALMMHVWPKLQKVVTGFLWLKSRQLDQETYVRDQLPEIWDNFLPRVARLEAAHKDNVWDPRPSGLCKNWCPVKTCEFCGSK